MIENFRTDLAVRAAAKPHADILKAMGYATPTAKNYRRLQRALESPDLGLSSGDYDFKYGGAEFLAALCRAVGVDPVVADIHIKRITTRLDEERAAFKPYIWADTGFVRTSQPLLALAACEHQRYLGFENGFWRYSLAEQLPQVKALIRKHVSEMDGKLGIWGKIKQYHFYYKKDAAYVFNPDAELIGQHSRPPRNKATCDGATGVISAAVQGNNKG